MLANIESSFVLMSSRSKLCEPQSHLSANCFNGWFVKKEKFIWPFPVNVSACYRDYIIVSIRRHTLIVLSVIPRVELMASFQPMVIKTKGWFHVSECH